MTALDTARDWCKRGYFPIPIPLGKKKPKIDEWPKLRITAESAPTYFNGVPQNIGVLLGDDYGAADVDLDSLESLGAAGVLLPETGLKFGRQSKPASHYFYRIDPCVASIKLCDPIQPNQKEATVIELRCQKKDGTTGFQTVVPSSTHESGEQIRFEPGFDRDPANIDADVLTRAVFRVGAAALLARHWPGAGSGRNDAFLALAGILARAGWSQNEASDFHFAIYTVLWNTAADRNACAAEVRATFEKHTSGHETTGIPKLMKLVDKRIVNTALEWLEIQDKPSVASVKDEGPSPFEHEAPYPEPISEEGFYGIAGKFVGLVEGHVEADPNFLLISFLVYAGNLLGRDAFVWAGADKHYPNLFEVGVGTTTTGRKGSASGPPQMFFEGIDPEWVKNNIKSGLSSGEGLIYNVRDEIKKMEDGKEIIIDEGVKDKRLLIVQSEFFGALQAMKRQGNTLSATIRDGWDRGGLNTLVKNNPAKATNAHISIIGNITKEELLRGMLTDEMDNGFANRFLWACSRRSKELPDGGRIWEVDFTPLRQAFNRVHGNVKGAVTRDAEAGDIWGHDGCSGGVYRDLTRERSGMLGKVCARAAPQVLRLSLIYALLDGSKEIRREHLEAALAIWNYCEASAAYIFGGASGDPTVDAIVGALQTAGTAGMTRTDLYLFFAKHKKSDEILRGLTILHKEGRARFDKEPTAGKPTERWFLTGGKR
jgi:hypothetical protein